MKNKILEYYEGNPDSVYNSETETSIHWADDDSVSFGFFPVDLNDSYEFMTGSFTHLDISENACEKLVGKAKHHISDDYFDFLRNQCYDKAYGLGRYWKNRNVISFWDDPSNEIVKRVISELKINPDYCIMVDKENNEEETTITVSDFMRSGGGSENGKRERMTPFRIDPKIRDVIERYNETEKSWQVQKERSGWDTIARRNAMIYQENKILKEYVDGDPDTVDEYDEETGEWVKSYRYNSSKCISFAFFETAPDKKEFVMSDEKGHSDISRDCAVKYVGKAMPHLSESEFLNIAYKIYHTAAYKGRIFLEPKVVTFWRRTSPDKVEQILNMLGGVEKFRDFMFIIPYQWDADNPKKQDREVPLEWYIAGEYPEYSENHSDNEEHMEERVMGLLPSDLREKIVKYNTVETNGWAANKEREGWKTLAQRNNTIYQENKTNMKTNKYEKEFSNYLQIMSEALSKKDFAVFDAAKEMLEETVDDCKKEQGLLKEMNTTNFGVLNHIFEEALPTLIKSNKKAVRNVIKTIKEDKNLMAEFNFYNIIDNYNSKISESVAPDVIFDKLSETILEKIDHKEIKKSNKKLRDVMCESGIIPLSHVSDEKMKLYESGNYMLSTAPSMSNVYKMYENKNNVINYLDSHKNDVVTEAVKPEELINNFEKELKEKLTESEISFVQQITDFRSPIAEQRKEKLFNKFKNECIDKINDMLKEDSNNVELKGLSDQINEMKFNKETIVKDIAKLLEIRDILLDE